MISEFLEYVRSSAPKVLKDLGYVYSSIALERRARRQKRDWAEHIRCCHEFWQQILEGQSYKSIAILGSGPLTEVPMDYVLEHCDELHLIDIVQPRSVKKKWGHKKNIYLHESDVTGAVNWLEKNKYELPKDLNFQAPVSHIKTELVVSANLMSQLTLEPSWYLSKKFSLKEDSLFMQELIGKILTEHLEHLETYGAKKKYIYTDVHRDYISPAGELLETHSSRVLPEHDLGYKIKEWRWKLCPLGEESDEYEIQMLIAAFDIASSTA